MTSRRSGLPGRPVAVTLYPTPEGWRHSSLDRRGGLLCGRLFRLAPDAAPAEARTAMAALIVDLCADFHDLAVRLDWEPTDRDGWWTASVVPLHGR